MNDNKKEKARETAVPASPVQTIVMWFVRMFGGGRRKRVFLGGTCNESKWREQMENFLDKHGLDYFNPVIDDWDAEAQKNELKERNVCDFCLYTITPKMLGVYAIAEVVDDSNKRPEKTVFVMLRSDGEYEFDDGQWRSLKAVADMVERNGGESFEALHEASLFMAGR